MPLVGPWGSLLLRFENDNTAWIGLGRPEPALFVARFANLLRKPGNDDEIPLLQELREHVARAAQNGMELAEVAGWHPLNPNAAIRPSLSRCVLDTQGDRETNLQNLQVSIEPASLRPWILRPHNSSRVVPVLTCAANLGARDAATSALAQLALAHGWEFLAFGFPQFQSEQKRWHHLPRLILDDDIVLSGERWTLEKAFVSRLGKLSGVDRYLAWIRELERINPPELVHIHTCPDEPELLMCTNSPLAVQCIFDACKGHLSNLFLTELTGDPAFWPVTDGEGQHYLAEIAITWCADQYWENWLK